jgi:hypothetical protein
MIPQCILVVGGDLLIKPLSVLFKLIYKHAKVPDQWLVAKTVPIFKNKGSPKIIKNY